MPFVPRPPRFQPRAGLTLVEVLVAILVLTAGALSTIGTQVAVARLSARSLAQQRNATAAATLLDSLRTTPCSALASGTSTSSLAQLSWTATPSGDLVALYVSVVPTTGAPWNLETLVPCA